MWSNISTYEKENVTLICKKRRRDSSWKVSLLQTSGSGGWSVVGGDPSWIDLNQDIYRGAVIHLFCRVGHIILLSFLLFGPKSDFNLVYQSYSVVLLCLRGQYLNTICECNVYLTTGNQLELSSYSVVGINIIFSGICLRSQHLNTIVCVYLTTGEPIGNCIGGQLGIIMQVNQSLSVLNISLSESNPKQITQFFTGSLSDFVLSFWRVEIYTKLIADDPKFYLTWQVRSCFSQGDPSCKWEEEHLS